MEQFSTVSLEIWTVHMISGYLHLTNRKDQFGAICAPFGVMTLFGWIFFTQIFFLTNFFLHKFFLAQIFFFFHFSVTFFFFFLQIFNIISQVIQVNVSCMLTGDIKMMYVACYNTYYTIWNIEIHRWYSDMLHVATPISLVLYILIR